MFGAAAVLAMCRAVVGRSEAPMDVVVDHADVLHEGVHTRGLCPAGSASLKVASASGSPEPAFPPNSRS